MKHVVYSSIGPKVERVICSDQPARLTLALSPRWILPEQGDAAAVDALAAELAIPESACRLLLRRGHGSPGNARSFLRPRLDQLHDPLAMLSLDTAVERLSRAIRDGELIMIHGDYDVDGICSTTLLTRSIRMLGGLATPFIPNRMTDGYDLGAAGVAAALVMKASIVVTCDCGTSARQPIAELCRHGIDVIVTDHHLPGDALPDCVAVLNPRRDGCGYPDKDLAAVGVAFKLVLALTKALGRDDGFVWGMLDLVALATVADVAPLRGENRVFVRKGLKLLAETRNYGLRAMIRASGLEGKPLTAGRIGFILAPRLNAAGRIGHALRGVELLMSESDAAANPIARELEELNVARQSLDRRTLDEARALMAAVNLDDTFGIVLWSEGWHPGVIGIVASRIVEEFGRPAVLIAVENGQGKGSGRSIPAFDLHGGLRESSDLLVRFGGHRAAAGITIAEENLPDFAARFNAIAKSKLSRADLVPELRVDLELEIDGANAELESVLRHFEPFGVGNPAPVFVSRGVRLAAPPRVIGKDGLKLRLLTRSGEIEGIGWGLAGRAAEFSVGTPYDIAFRLDRDEYKGESRLQARIADILPAQSDRG